MPSTIYLVTGGCRSGKSRHAQDLCERICQEPVYLATASGRWEENAGDADFARRIKRHQADRGEMWTTVEEPLRLSKRAESFKGRAVLVDCLTLWLTNFMMEEGAFTIPTTAKSTTGGDNDDNDNGNVKEDKGGGANDDDDSIAVRAERALEAAKKEFDALVEPWNVSYVFVTNEVGSGTHASTQLGRKFVDAQGWFNQYVAAKAEIVTHMVCGIPSVIKDSTAAPKRRKNRQDHNTNCHVPPGPQDALEARMLDKYLSARSLEMDARGYFLVKLDRDGGLIRALFFSCMKNEAGEICDLEGKKISCCNGEKRVVEPMQVFEAPTAKALTVQIFEQWPPAKMVLSLGHAAYMGREIQKAEYCLYAGEHYQQD